MTKAAKKEGVPPSFAAVVGELSRLPGVGEKSAERLAFYLLNQPPSATRSLADALNCLHERVRYCKICHNLAEGDLCRICGMPKRSEAEVVVVEMPQDLMRIEETCDFRGRYHVLGGRFAPLEGIFPDNLNIESLRRRLRSGEVKELILALNPTSEGEATAELLRREFQNLPVRITRLATGLPHGSELGWVSRSALTDAFRYRREA